jgi:hypothetical protein
MGMIGHDYEIRFVNAEGALSFLYMTNCATDEQAREAAQRMFRQEFATYEIWRDNVCVDAGECILGAKNSSG